MRRRYTHKAKILSAIETCFLVLSGRGQIGERDYRYGSINRSGILGQSDVYEEKRYTIRDSTIHVLFTW
ncbi:hypothetical protein KQX54_007425 [Cotesia glomerata]|uniref:Uncharacterized protein n=1 Tax=Cotesia glomerata TaxID=32391 RepID=A0AAV7IGK4_COTGL|nr:hypothetical protein KQX54_007425 [Cotesia glomerata]